MGRVVGLGESCSECRRDFHCGKCACCMPIKKLRNKVNKIKKSIIGVKDGN